jgi:HPt (histidine-containing phosphotransfer) domain-containing protein
MDWKDLRRSSAAASIHKLKGSAAAIGATNLAEACAALERSLKNRDTALSPEEPGLFTRLHRELDESLLEQEQWLARHNSRIAPLISSGDEALRQGLNALRKALEAGDMRAYELHEQLQHQRPPASPLAWQTLDDAVERFDVGAALAALDTLNKETVPATPSSSTGVEAKNPGTIDLSR